MFDDFKTYYFENVVSSLFKQENPNQILFSLLHQNQFVGYGGLVHINWLDRNAEISFIMKTRLQEESFEYYWMNFIGLLENLAFKELHFHKIFTYAFDVRPHYTQFCKNVDLLRKLVYQNIVISMENI